MNRDRAGWEPEMPRGPRCGQVTRLGDVCVRRAGHPSYHWSAYAYRSQLEATGRWRASLGRASIADYDPVKLLGWGPELLRRKRAEWRAGISSPGDLR